jgi:hypothetical protein
MLNSFLDHGPTVASVIFTLIGIPVNGVQQLHFDLFSPGVKVALAVGPRLCGYRDHRHVRLNMLGEPVSVDTQIMMREVCAYPASPSDLRLTTHIGKIPIQT